MSEDLPDPTPVTGELESFAYRQPRLRITATYDNPAGTGRPTSMDVEIHDDDTPDPAFICQIVADVTAVLANLGARTVTRTVPPPGPPFTPAVDGSISTTSGSHVIWSNDEGRAAA